VTPAEVFDEATPPLPSRRVFELDMSPKTKLKKVMRQAIWECIFSNSESIFTSSNREALGRKYICFLYIIHAFSSFTEICYLQLIEGCEFK